MQTSYLVVVDPVLGIRNDTFVLDTLHRAGCHDSAKVRILGLHNMFQNISITLFRVVSGHRKKDKKTERTFKLKINPATT